MRDPIVPAIEVDLSGLRDIHIPIEPHWWPLPLGWWLVIGAFICTLFILFCAFLYWYTRPKQYALRELKSLYIQEKNPILFARKISLLLKRIALLNYPRTEVATLTDERWVLFLKEHTGLSFSEGQLNLLALATYMPETALNPGSSESLYKATRKGISLLFDEVNHEYKS
jgi:hypothetical protein